MAVVSTPPFEAATVRHAVEEAGFVAVDDVDAEDAAADADLANNRTRANL